MESLAHIQLANSGAYTPKNLTLNGELIKKNAIYVTPGPYVLTYSIERSSPAWASFQQTAAGGAYSHRYGGFFCQGELVDISMAPIMVRTGYCIAYSGARVEVSQERKAFEFEAGQTYTIDGW